MRMTEKHIQYDSPASIEVNHNTMVTDRRHMDGETRMALEYWQIGKQVFQYLGHFQEIYEPILTSPHLKSSSIVEH